MSETGDCSTHLLGVSEEMYLKNAVFPVVRNEGSLTVMLPTRGYGTCVHEGNLPYMYRRDNCILSSELWDAAEEVGFAAFPGLCGRPAPHTQS